MKFTELSMHGISKAMHAKKKPRKPLYTVKEMAKEIGVSMAWLRELLGTDEDAPKPELSNSSSTGRKYYDRDLVLAWWSKRPHHKSKGVSDAK